MPSHRAIVTTLVVLLASSLGCVVEPDDESGSSSGSSSSDTGESSSADTGAETDTGTETDTGDPVMCPETFPMFDKACVADSDCVLVMHTTSCCGTEVAWGINAAEAVAFEAAEAVCDSQYPGCGCAPAPTLAEDGNEVIGPDAVAVACQIGLCASYVP